MATVTIDSTEFTTYIDVGDARAYAFGSINADDYIALTAEGQAIHLVSATRVLERQSWKGEKTDEAQALEWPRTDVTGYDDDEIPQKVIDACCEIAFALAAGSNLQDAQNQSQQIQSLKAGSVALEYFRGADGIPLRFPLIISELLRGLLSSGITDGSDLLSGGLSFGTAAETVSDEDFGTNLI